MPDWLGLLLLFTIPTVAGLLVLRALWRVLRWGVRQLAGEWARGSKPDDR